MKSTLKKIGVIVTVIFLLLKLSISTAQNHQFRHYSSEEGFTGSAWKRMTQDSLGFLWITSGTGLFKFDGYNFTRYNITKHGVVSVDSQGRIWIGADDQVIILDPRSETLDSISLPSPQTIPNSFIFKDNKAYISTTNAGLLLYDQHSRKLTQVENDLDPKAESIFCLLSEGSSLLMGTSHGLWRYDYVHKKFSRPFEYENTGTLLYSGTIKKIFQHHDYYWIWVGSQFLKVRNGSILNSLDFEKVRLQFDPEKKFLQSEITRIAETPDEKFWIATSGIGLIYYDPETNRCTNFRHDENDQLSPPSDVLYDVMIDRDQNLWFTTVTKGIVQLKKRSIIFHNYLKGMSSTSIITLTDKTSTQIFAGTNGNGLWTARFDKQHIANLNFENVKINASGFENILRLAPGKTHLWIGSFNAGVAGLPLLGEGQVGHDPEYFFKHDPKEAKSITQNFITGLYESVDGYLWVGTLDRGLNIGPALTSTSQFSHYQHDQNNEQSLQTDGVRMIEPQNDGSIFIISHGGVDKVVNPNAPYADLKFENLFKGAYCSQLVKTTRGTYVVTTGEGLAELIPEGDTYRVERIPIPAEVPSLQEDLLGRLWLMTFDGMYFYDPKTKFLLQFKKEDGLLSSRTVSAGRATQTSEGVMLFSNAEGLTVFDPLSLKINESKPRPLLTRIKINDEEISPKKGEDAAFPILQSISTLKNLELDHTHHILEIEFSAMDMTAPEKNQYQYILQGFGDKWRTADWHERTATYTNLKPGEYTFKVRASNRDGVWSPYEASMKIVVLPAPWKTWWAYTIYAFIIVGMLYAARRSILNEERLKASLRIEQIELEKNQIELRKVQEVDKLKSSFFTNISHEFRTPLTLIQGPVQLLMEKFSNDPLVRRQLTLINNNTVLLLKLINQLLEMARLESGTLSVETTQTDLNSFLHSVVQHFETQALQKKLWLRLENPTLATIVAIDESKIETILINLIGNAIKFTPENGTVIVKAQLEGSGNGHHKNIQTLCITVSDNGIGIPRDQQKFIFDRFYQVNETHRQIGTGIGLAIVKELTELMQGSVEVKSEPDHGSEFKLRIPVEVITIVPTTKQQPVEHAVDFRNTIDMTSPHEPLSDVPRILVVEDNPDVRQFIMDSFKLAYQFIEASTGTEGVAKAINEIPELIISDIMMPEMDGISMSTRIKKDIRTCHIPILFLTAKATDENKLIGLETGAEDYLTKPFNKDELILKVRNILASREKIREKLRLELLSEAPNVVVQSSDEQFLANVKDAIHQRLNDPELSVETLCETVGLSKTQLYRKLTALTGLTVNEMIRKFRLKRAAHLLNQQWGGVSEVAYEVGFGNLSYFSKCFKEEFGVVPSEYSKR